MKLREVNRIKREQRAYIEREFGATAAERASYGTQVARASVLTRVPQLGTLCSRLYTPRGSLLRTVVHTFEHNPPALK